MALTRLNTPTGTAIPSAANINLDFPNSGNQVHITGTNTITSVTLTSGNKTVIFDGVLTLTHNAISNNLPGGVSITTAVGDRALYAFDGVTVYCVSYVKAISDLVNFAGVLNTARATVASAATTANIWNATGNVIDYTGTVTTTGFPSAPQAGASRTLDISSTAAFTASINMLIDGAALGDTVICAAGDTMIVTARSTTVFRLTRFKRDGTATASSSSYATQFKFS